MKKLITSFLAFVILLSATGNVFSASNDSTTSQVEYVADILSGLNIYDNSGSLTGVMSRIEFVRELSSVIDKENTFTYNEADVGFILDVSKSDKRYVALALQKGIIKKPEEGKFYPDREVDLDFASYAFVAMSGYVLDLHRENYIYKANELGIMKGVNASTGITRADFILMLYNYLDVNYLLHTGFGNNEKYEPSDKNVLEGIYGIEKFDARLVASSYSDMTNTVHLSEGYISLQMLKNGAIETYQCDFEFDAELMGRNVTVFYDSDEEIVKYMVLRKGDSCIFDIKGADFSYFDLSTRKIYYKTLVSGSRWEQSYRERSVSIPVNVDIIYNEQFTLDHNFVYSVLCGNESLNIGRVCLYDIDNDSKADLMRVEAYTNVVVKSVNTDKEAIIDNLTGNMFELHITDNDYIVDLEDTSGNNVLLSDIKKDDIVSVYIGKGSKIMIKAVVSRKEETDSAIYIDNENGYIETENGKYYLSYELINSGLEFVPGKEYRFLLDEMGNIAKVLEDNSIYNNIGSVVKAKWSRDDDAYNIEIFTANGDFVTYKTSRKLKVGESKVDQSGKVWTFVDENSNTVNFADTITKGIIQFEVNQNNEIRRIYLPKKNAGKGELTFSLGISDPDDVFSNPENHILRYKTNGRYFIPTSSGNANNFVVLKKDTKIMTVPADTITSGRDTFCNVNSTLKNDAEASAVGYTFSSGSMRADLVVIVNSGSVNIDNSPYYVVTKKYMALNSDERPALTLKCMNSSGSTFEFVGSDEKIPQCDTETGSIINNDVSVSVGDVIKIALDNFGEISAIGKAYDYVTKTGISVNPSYWYASKRFVSASVYDIDEDAVSYILGNAIDGSTDISANLQMVGLGRTKAIIVKPKGSTVDVWYGNITDAVSYKDSSVRYSRFVLSGGYGETSFVVFYLQE